MSALEVQETFDLFQPPPPKVHEGECAGCGKWLSGYFDVAINHGMSRRDGRAGGLECTAMMLTLSHVLYQHRVIAEPDVEWHARSSNCQKHSRKNPATREHVQQFELNELARYLNRVHEVWPADRHAALDAYIAAHARLLGVTDLISGDEVPEWRP